MMLLDGDIVRTRNGRAEIVFGDGTLLHLDFDDGDRNARARAAAPAEWPRVVARVGRRRSRLCRRHAGRQRSTGLPRGEYGITADQLRGDLEVSVARGVAEIDDGSQRVDRARRRDA